MTLDKNKNWKDISSLNEVVDYILEIYHQPLEKELEEIPELIESCLEEDSSNEVLTTLQTTFEEIKETLVDHLFKEENILFPMMRQLDELESSGEGIPSFHCGSISNPIGQMEYEHQNLDDTLAIISRVTDNYSSPKDASINYQQLMYRLSDFDVELRKHADLEDSVLHVLAKKKEDSLC